MIRPAPCSRRRQASLDCSAGSRLPFEPAVSTIQCIQASVTRTEIEMPIVKGRKAGYTAGRSVLPEQAAGPRLQSPESAVIAAKVDSVIGDESAGIYSALCL